jgi:hypothetical protein
MSEDSNPPPRRNPLLGTIGPSGEIRKDRKAAEFSGFFVSRVRWFPLVDLGI